MTTNSNLKSTENQSTTFQKSTYQEIKVEVFERRIFIKLPKNEKDITFIRSLTYSKWDSTWFHHLNNSDSGIIKAGYCASL